MAWCPYATQKAITENFEQGKMGAIQGLVIHITDGAGHPKRPPSLAGVWGWFNNPTAKASAHFCISKEGKSGNSLTQMTAHGHKELETQIG